MMKENDQFILDIKRLGINGEGIGFYNKLAVFVPNAIPGEGHDVLITKLDKKMAQAKTISIKTASPNRINPACPYFNECGACQVMHIKYDAMLDYKRDLVIEALNRYTTLNTRSFEIKKTIPSDKELGYRNKSQLPIRKENNSLSVCMLRAGSNDQIPVNNCLVNSPLINKLNKEIMELATKLDISPYIYKFNRGVLKYLVIRVNKNNEALVCLICHEKNSKIKDLANEIMKLEGVKGVYENFNNSSKQGVIFGEETNHLAGDKYIIEKLGNISFEIYPTTFFQLNSYQAEKLYDIVLKSCKLSYKERVLDAFCGVGTISIALARMTKEIVGIEYNKKAIEAAIENAKINKITNAKFLQGDATQLLPKMINDGDIFDVVVADPPRTGLGDDFINALLTAEVKRIIYVSCNPATLAKDLEKLSIKYNVNSITPIDMFPQTAHVECVAYLELKKAKN